jgi:hypothetical protein
VSPTWITSPTQGYFLGHTYVTADPQQQPYVIVHPLTTSENVKRAFTTYRPGQGWSDPPTLLPWSAGLLFFDTLGTMTAISSGIRFHRSKPGANQWTMLPLEINQGAFQVTPDVAYFRQTNQFRLSALKVNGTSASIKIWTVHFADTAAPHHQSPQVLPPVRNLRRVLQ